MRFSDVCLSIAYIGPKSRTERTRTPLSSQKVKVLQAALLSTALTRKAVSTVTVGRYSACESTATLRLLDGMRGVWASTVRGEGPGYTVSPRAQLVTSVIRQLIQHNCGTAVYIYCLFIVSLFSMLD